MEASCPNNLMDVDSLVESFMREHASGIATMHRIYFHTDNQLSIRALTAELVDELRTGCVTFINKNESMDGLNPYLFYITNAFCKKRAVPQVKKKTEYVCPGCLFQNKETQVQYSNNVFKCHACEAELKSTNDPKKIMFYRTFFRHSKIGYHCLDCDRFIPHPSDDSPTVSCPYFDCCFVGSWISLKRMHHPTIKYNPESLILDSSREESGTTMKDSVPSHEAAALSKIEIKEDLENRANILLEVIDYQRGNVPYSSSDFTVKHKILVYKAFENLLKSDPQEMIGYLLNQSRSGGFQHRVFQEYIRLLENSLPYNIKKGNKLYKIESLLDDSLCLFDGISVFNAIITDKQEIKNNTQEYYIGGRKASYSKPFYIGKLLNVLDAKNNSPLMNQVVEYSFSKIKMKDVDPGTEVVVTHLRIPPHYQMGGMVYVNRVRKKIVDRAQFILNKELNETSNVF